MVCDLGFLFFKKWGQVNEVNMKQETQDTAVRKEHFADLNYSEIQSLEYQLLLLGDLAFVDSKQRKAYRQLLRRTIWFNWAANLANLTEPDLPVGMPNLETIEE